jgi:bifunctional non-homologous end joining protein LigD
MPLEWDDLRKVKSGDAFTIKNAMRHIGKRNSDPWEGIADVTQELPDFS